jgi:proline racemase
MAALVATGTLAIGSPFINEGVMGTTYKGMAVAKYSDDKIHGIVPEVEGRAWLTASAQLFVNPRDPLGNGYLIGGGRAVL